MNYPETISYLYSRLPMFTKVGATAIKKGLNNTIALCKALDNPHKKFKSIHVGGTNGKGSTSHMLAAILQIAGYKTGLYTSPHLRDFRERIRVNGEMISEEEVVRFVNSQHKTIETIQPSFFEVTVAMAFDHFANENVDLAVVEVGLGGRLDSTNVITPVISVITNIGYDHMNILGNSLSEIASEKAGIIKPGIPVIIGEKQDEVANLFIEKALGVGTNVSFASEQWKVSRESRKPGISEHTDLQDLELQTVNVTSVNDLTSPTSFQLDLTGIYQLKNIRTVLSAVEELKKHGYYITEEHVATALQQVKRLTGLMGRWQTLSYAPLVICDTAHNEDGIREALKNIESTPFKALHVVLGMVKDKDVRKVLGMLPSYATYYFCQPQLERAKPVDELAKEAKVFGLNGSVFHSVKDALSAAKAAAASNDLIFIGGSTFVVSEVV